MGSSQSPREVAIVKKVHLFSHSSAQDMKGLFKDARSLTDGIERACDKVYDACDICASSGRPQTAKKISFTHANGSFNNEVQADFVVVYIRDRKLFVLNIVDTGTRYGERQSHKHGMQW